MSYSQRIDLIQRYLSGERAYLLAREYGLARQSVAAIVDRAGVRRPKDVTDGETDEIRRLRESGLTARCIAERSGRSERTVRRVFGSA